MDTGKIADILSMMQKTVECPICLDVMKMPVTTRCHHQFCSFCISAFMETKSSAPCPLCKQDITKRTIQPSEVRSDIIETLVNTMKTFQQENEQNHNENQQTEEALPHEVKIVCTGLTLKERLRVREFAILNDFSVLESFDSEAATHLVTADPMNCRKCPRTLKYLQAMASHCWIVSLNWINESLETDDEAALPEAAYEMVGDTADERIHYGPRKSRLEQNLLFQDYAVTCIGSSDEMKKGTMVSLLEQCGAQVIEDLWILSQTDIGDREKIVIRFCDGAPISVSEQEILNCFHVHSGICTVTQNWFVDTLASYCARSPLNYLVAPRDLSGRMSSTSSSS